MAQSEIMDQFDDIVLPYEDMKWLPTQVEMVDAFKDYRNRSAITPKIKGQWGNEHYIPFTYERGRWSGKSTFCAAVVAFYSTLEKNVLMIVNSVDEMCNKVGKYSHLIKHKSQETTYINELTDVEIKIVSSVKEANGWRPADVVIFDYFSIDYNRNELDKQVRSVYYKERAIIVTTDKWTSTNGEKKDLKN